MPLSPGTQLGSYQVVSPLGAGGMGEVYRARDSKLGRDVAIKVLPDALAADADRIARFEREAKVLAALNHPHIAAVYGMEQSSGRHFLIMELVEGETLAERLRRGALPPRDALAVARQIAEAVEAAHEKNVIYRDLKPANVKITPDDKVKVLDFGLAKAMETGPGAADVTHSPTLSVMATQAGLILGTAAYMSPEQAKGAPADHRSDVFSFGVVLYEMLTGRQAFIGDTAAEILAAVLLREPDVSLLPGALNPRVIELLRRCLDKNPKRRWQAAGDLRAEFETLAASAETAAPPPGSERGRPRRERLAWSAAAIAATAAIGLAIPAGLHLRETPPEPMTIQSTVLAPDGATLEFTNGIGLPALSPDGRRIVFGARTADGPQSLWVRSLDGLTAQPLAGTGGATFPFWSPDSQFIAFFADGKLKKISAGGGPVLTLADAPLGRGGSWSRNGVIVFSPSNGPGIQRVSSAGGLTNPVTSASGSFPWFLPDGEHFLFQDQSPDFSFRVGSLSGENSAVMGAGSNAMYANGHLLFLREGTLMAQPFDPDRTVTTGEAFPLAESVQTVLASGRVGVFSASDTGLLLYRQGGGSLRQLIWLDRTGKTVGTVGEPDDGLLGAPELSPDERRVAVYRSVQRNTDIWLIDLVRGGNTRFTFNAGIDEFPVWSRDGMHITFSSHRGNESGPGWRELYTKPSNGTGAEQLLLGPPRQFRIPHGWSPDGKFLLYREITDTKTGSDLWALPAEGDRKPVPIANSPFIEQSAQFSPDGRWVAYSSNESGSPETYVVSFPAGSGKWQVSTAGGFWPRWRRDGRELFFVTTEGQMMAAGINASGAAFEAALPVVLFDIPSGAGAGPKPQYAVSGDGRFLFTASVDAATAASMTLVQNWMPRR